MDIRLPAYWDHFTASLIRAGRYSLVTAVIEDGLRPLEEREAKVANLRKTIDEAVARGGSHSDEEVAAAVSARLAVLVIPDAAE